MKDRKLIGMALKSAGKSESWLARRCGYTKQNFNQRLKHGGFGDSDIDLMLKEINAVIDRGKKQIILNDGIVINWRKYRE